MKVLVVAEHDKGNLKPSSLSVLNCALQLTDKIDYLVMGDAADKAAQELSQYNGVDTVYSCANISSELAENASKYLSKFIKDNSYSHIFMAASTSGKNTLPRVSAMLDVDMLSDVIEVIDHKTYKRPIYAGNAIATIENNSDIQIMTVRPTAFSSNVEAGNNAEIINCDNEFSDNRAEYIGTSQQEADRPDLGSAKVVISGGRGLGSKDNFSIIYELADKLNAAVGASRAAVDAGFVANDLQVGQTGKVVAPDLYIAIGISGAIQHIAGMKDSKVIVAVNKDPEAPIFQVADYGLVGDLFEVVPKLNELL